MTWLLEKIGSFLDWLVGDRKTLEYNGEAAFRSVTLRPTLAEDDVEIGVTVTRIVYETRYKRWWLPSTVHSVYHVLAFAPEDIRSKLDPRLFQPMVYPLLCNALLQRSRYPHMYALHAFLERMSPYYPTIKCEL